MTYQETLAYLYNSAPLFQHIGKAAYKEGLENTLALDEYFGHPHKKFRSIHVAGTNGKGSCSHTLAAVNYTNLTLPTSELVSSSVVAVSLKKKRRMCCFRLVGEVR